jgi:two-component system OmpR family response regulator
MRVLVVEDDPRMRELLLQGLEEEGHAVASAVDGDEGLEMARAHSFDLIVLDLMLPKLDGVEIARRLRRDRRQTPILMLTARDQTPDIVLGLDSGADDYLTKPFSFDVFLARVRAVSRRGPIPQPVRLRFGDLELDTGTREVWRSGQVASLSRTEYSLLELLMRRAGSVVPREVILDTVWGFGADVEANTLDAFVRLLRHKIEPTGARRILRTVRGVGYSLREEDA